LQLKSGENESASASVSASRWTVQIASSSKGVFDQLFAWRTDQCGRIYQGFVADGS